MSMLSALTHTKDTPAEQRHEQHDKLVKQAQQWVGLSFFEPILKEAREGPFHSDIFDGGQGGKAFGALYDQQISQRIARGAGSKLVNSIVRRIEGRRAYEQSGKAGARVKGEHVQTSR